MDLQTITSGATPLLAGLFVASLVYGGYRAWTRREAARAQGTIPVKVPNGKKAGSCPASTKDRAPGEWTPVKFDYPRLEPNAAHFSTVKPIPYRPFRWGDYHVTMGIRNMPWDEWIELDREFPYVHKPGIVGSGHAAAAEFAQELAEYLSRRHPDMYRVTRHPASALDDENGWYGEGRIKTITIIPFQEVHDLEKEEPLKAARALIQEDFAIMLEGSDGRYYLQAGAICVAGGWRLQDKLGMPLEDIHVSGNVAQYKAKLQTSMDRYFRRMAVDKAVVRNNYSFQVVAEPEMREPAPPVGSLLDVDPEELSWAVTMHGEEEDSSLHGQGEDMNGQQDVADAAAAELSSRPYKTFVKIEAPVTAGTLRLRTERQTLRRLPRTGAIVFTIRVYQTRFDELMKEPGVPGRVASALRSWPEDVARYKSRVSYEDILPYLDKCHAEQVEEGIMSEEGKKDEFPF